MVSASATAGEYTLKAAPQSLADWKNGTFYVGGVAPTDANAAEAIVTLPANMTAKVDDGSVAFVGSFSWIKPTADTSVLEVDIDTDASFPAMFAATTNSSSHVGKLVKKGTGMLSFQPGGAYDHYVSVDVKAGTLALPEQTATAKKNVNLWDVDVAVGATLRPSANAGNYKVDNNWNSLSGGGDVTNGLGTSSVNCGLYVGYGNQVPAIFSGRILDMIKWQSHGYEYFTGTESTFKGGFGIQSNSEKMDQGIVGAVKLGMKNAPSSIGAHSTITFSEWGGRLLYLGEGETSDKVIYVAEGTTGKKRPGIFDAGATGGLNLTGNLTLLNIGGAQRLHLTGSNTLECVINGEFPSNSATVAYIVKKGSGTWRFAGEKPERGGIGGVAVEEGTLAFDSIADVGVKSALGPGMVFTEDVVSTSVATRTNVPYFFRVGTADTTGTLSFSGTTPSASSTRPMALAGDAVLVNNATNSAGEGVAFIYSDISSLTAGAKKLTLTGTNTEVSVVASISNGMGVVSVEKTGSGTWALAGTNNTFTGGIDVKEGKMLIRGLGDFKWYRWTIRENQAATGVPMNRVSEFAFFDKDNLRVGLGLTISGGTLPDSNFNPEDYLVNIAPGTVAFGKRLRWLNNWSPKPDSLSALFDGVQSTYTWIDARYNGWTAYQTPTPSDPATWLTIVMRLADGEREPKSYDWGCYGVNVGQNPKGWLMEGSHDGYIWHVIDDVTDGPWTTNTRYSFQWAYNKTGDSTAQMGTAESPHANGRRFEILEAAPPTVYNQAVSVASGATLEGVGDVVLSSLKVNPASGGTIRNVAFSAGGEIDIASKFNGSSAAIPLTFENVTGLENVASWSVSVDGNPNATYKVAVTGGKIYVTRPGFVILFK